MVKTCSLHRALRGKEEQLEGRNFISSSDRGSDLLQIRLLDPKTVLQTLVLLQELAQGLFLLNEHQLMRQHFWVIIQQVWFLFKAMLSVFCMIKSESKPAEIFSQKPCALLPCVCTWILATCREPAIWYSIDISKICLSLFQQTSSGFQVVHKTWKQV